jgi:hypothetical protein
MAANSNGNLSNPLTISGAQHGDKISIADATQFNNTPITAANVTASGGSTTSLPGWVNAVLSAQGAGFSAGDTLVQLVGAGTTNESAAAISGHTVTL